MGNTPAPITRAPDYLHPVNVSLRASQISPTEEPPPTMSVTVLNGEDAEPGEFPHQVALGPVGQFANCGASIIHPLLLLTTAHCVLGKKPEDIEAVAGEHQQTIVDGEEVGLSIKEFVIHENYRPKHNDIAIIVLKKEITPTLRIKQIDIAEPQENLPGEALVSGWGRTLGPGTNADILQKARLSFTDLPTCRQQLGEVDDNMICAGGERDACTGDSGGPLTCEDNYGKKYLCGITSWGVDCDKKEELGLTVPGVFVDVRKYNGWIRREMERWWRHYWNTMLGQPLTVSGDCGEGRFKCGMSGLCLPDGFRCDGQNDCAPWDDSDERGCQNVTCPVGSVACEGTRRCATEEHSCDELDYGGGGSKDEYDYE